MTRSSGRRVCLAALAVLWLSACGVATGMPAGAQPRRVTADPGVVHYRDPDGWRLTYPDSMSRQRLRYGPSGAGEGWTEVTFANFPLPPGGTGDRGTGGPPLGPGGTFPADGIAFRMSIAELPQSPAPDSRFPVRLSYLSPSSYSQLSPGQYPTGEPPRVRVGTIVGDGVQYQATVFIAPRVSPHWRAALRGVVASLRFPHLHPGRNSNGAYVLPAAGDYPVGSFTRMQPTVNGGSPFFLVHAPGRLPIARCKPEDSCIAPGGFYALFWKVEHGGNAYSCDIQFDRGEDEFYCTNSAARWDRVGAVITVPRGSRARDPLQMSYLTTSWDGQLILSGIDSGVGQPGPAALRILWPGWRR